MQPCSIHTINWLFSITCTVRHVEYRQEWCLTHQNSLIRDTHAQRRLVTVQLRRLHQSLISYISRVYFITFRDHGEIYLDWKSLSLSHAVQCYPAIMLSLEMPLLNSYQCYHSTFLSHGREETARQLHCWHHNSEETPPILQMKRSNTTLSSLLSPILCIKQHAVLITHSMDQWKRTQTYYRILPLPDN